jgi:hypothetical protein
MHIRFHRGTPAVPEDSGRRPTSVHVLNDEHDLRAALQRAAEFDQRAADMLLSRSAHYRALLGDPPDSASAAD